MKNKSIKKSSISDDERWTKYEQLKEMVPESVFNRREMLREFININTKKK